MKIDEDNDVRTFFDIIASNLLIPFIINLTRVTPSTKTIIDNIFPNSLEYRESISGNLRTSISDHCAQFLIIPRIDRSSSLKQNLFKRDRTNFNNDTFIEEVSAIEWYTELDIASSDINKSFILLEAKVNLIIDKHMPLKKLTRKEIKLKETPWINSEIRSRERDKIHEKIEEHLKRFKELRNKNCGIVS